MRLTAHAKTTLSRSRTLADFDSDSDETVSDISVQSENEFVEFATAEDELRLKRFRMRRGGNMCARCLSATSRGLHVFYSWFLGIGSVGTHIASLLFFIIAIIYGQRHHNVICETPIWLWLMFQNLVAFPCATWLQVIIRNIFDVDTSPENLDNPNRAQDPRPVRMFKRVFVFIYFAWQIFGWWIYIRARDSQSEYSYCSDESGEDFLGFVQKYLIFFAALIFVFFILPAGFFMLLLTLSFIERKVRGASAEELNENENLDAMPNSTFAFGESFGMVLSTEDEKSKKASHRCAICNNPIIFVTETFHDQQFECTFLCDNRDHRVHRSCARKANKTGLSCPACLVGRSGT